MNKSGKVYLALGYQNSWLYVCSVLLKMSGLSFVLEMKQLPISYYELLVFLYTTLLTSHLAIIFKRSSFGEAQHVYLQKRANWVYSYQQNIRKSCQTGKISVSKESRPAPHQELIPNWRVGSMNSSGYFNHEILSLINFLNQSGQNNEVWVIWHWNIKSCPE